MVKTIITQFRERILAAPQVDLGHKDMFRLAMEHSGIGMALIALDGTWLKVNQAICNIVGYSEAELLAINFQTITHLDDLESDLIFVNQLLADDIQTYNMEKRYFHKSGSLIWAKLTVSLVRDEAKKPLYFISQIQDITAQKTSSEELFLAKQEMEEFAYRITHDLRSPLNSMDYVIDMVAEYIRKGDLPKALKTLQATQKGISKLSDLISGVLDVTKIKLQDEAPRPVDVAGMVNETLDSLRHMKNFVRLNIETQFEYTGILHTKPNKFSQVVDNLISNAIKYQDTSEANSFIRVITYKNDHEFVFEVRDNGLGVPTIYRDKLFQMFERFHPKASVGAGLGLYMVKKSADSLGGQLSYVVPECGNGSIFRFSLPLTLIRSDV
jgi:PAS domain S-box-containing protein